MDSNTLCVCIGHPAKTYIHQLCVDTGWILEDLPGVIGTDGERKSQGTMYEHDLMVIVITIL